MCGILGTNWPIDEQLFAQALGTIAHRGPDATGTRHYEEATLGHQRLAILDLSANGNQPMEALEGSVAIVYNGEIYNHQEIRQELEAEYRFKSTTDTETILFGYLKYGKHIVERLNGIFSFAIYDGRSHELFLARDPLGVKPLYYYWKNDRFAFASEIKAIFALGDLDQTSNYEAFVDYLHFLWSPGEGTPLRYVKKLLPGHSLTVTRGDHPGISIDKYYELPFTGRYTSDSEQALTDELEAKLCAAVERQMLSDVPVGFFLSGGLDSSLIAAIAQKQLGKAFNCYTIKVPVTDAVDGFEDDLKYARIVADHLQTNLVEVDGDSDIVRDFDQMIWHLDEPQADPAPLNVLNICRVARENGDLVLLGGTAGDDLFSGYRRHQALRWEAVFRPEFNFATKPLAALLHRCDVRIPLVRRVQKFLSGVGQSHVQRMSNYFKWIDLSRNKGLFAESLRSSLETYDPATTIRESLSAIPDEMSALNQMLFWELKYFLPDHNLNYTDKMSMAVGVEVRVPFLDLELVDFACRLPPSLKLKGSTTKYLLKKVAESYLPGEVIYRSKTGFGAPVREWICTGRMDPLLEEYLNRNRIEEYGLFDVKAVMELIEQTKRGTVDGAYTLWGLMAIHSWVKQFVVNRTMASCREGERERLGEEKALVRGKGISNVQ